MAVNPEYVPRTVEFTLNGNKITALEGETILQCGKRLGIDIPHLCYAEGMRPDGNCRACMVEITGERLLAPACARAPAEGMPISTAGPVMYRSLIESADLTYGQILVSAITKAELAYDVARSKRKADNHGALLLFLQRFEIASFDSVGWPCISAITPEGCDSGT